MAVLSSGRVHTANYDLVTRTDFLAVGRFFPDASFAVETILVANKNLTLSPLQHLCAGCTQEGGPPFAMSESLVSSLLEPRGFQAVHLEKLPASLCHEGRDGKTALGRWRFSTQP